MNTDTLTDAQIAAAMLPEDLNDATRTIARLQTSGARTVATTSRVESSPLTEPSEAEILAECSLRGWSYNDARNKLRSELQNEAARFNSVIPGATEKIAQANAQAAEAQAEAERALAEQRGILESLEQAIVHLGALRLRALTIRSTFGDRPDEAVQAAGIFAAWITLENSPSAENQSGYINRLNSLIRSTVLAKHVPAFVAKIEAQAAESAAAIKALAQTHGVNLEELLKLMRAEASGKAGPAPCRFPELLKYINADAYRDILA